MASNRQPDTLPELFTLADDAANGAHDYQASLPLKQNTEDAIIADTAAARAAVAAFKVTDSALSKAHGVLVLADSNVKAFLGKAKKAITGVLGDGWTPVFGEAGFSANSLALPRTQDERFDMIEKLPAFLTSHPACQDARPEVLVTPAAATTFYNALKTARGISNSKETDYGLAFTTRDTAVTALRTRLRGLVGELRQLLPDDSPVWYAFGFNAPADPSTPGTPLTSPFLSPGTAGNFNAVWGISRRSAYYHVWLQITGTDPAPVRVATTQDRAYTFTGIPSGKSAKVSITGVNDAGEGPPSPQVEIIVP